MAKVKKAQRGMDVPKGYVKGEMTGKLIPEKEFNARRDSASKSLQQAVGAKKAAVKAAVKKKMEKGGSLKPVDSSKNPGLAKLPTPVRNKMGYQKNGGKSKPKAKHGASLSPSSKSVSSKLGSYKKVIGKAKAGASVKKMMGGGKCKYGC